MEDRLSVLKRTFGEIVDLKEGNIICLKTLDKKIQQIQSMYSDFIHSNKEQLFVFSLDAFHFQSKLLDLEYEDMNRMFLSITNRMYCDYYKLFKIMVEYTKENIPDKKLAELIKVHDNFPVYKDLEPFKQYDFQLIQSLHEIILVILTYIHTFITNKEHDLKVYQTKNQTGLNIDSFVSTFSFNTIMMNQRAALFINYIEFFHKSHTKYLKRFMMKMNLMLSQLNTDIKFESASVDTKSAKKDMISNLKENNLDKKLLKELKISIADDSSLSDTRSKSGSGSDQEENCSHKDILEIFEQHQSDFVSELTDDVETKVTPKFSNTSQKNVFINVTKVSYEADLSVVNEEVSNSDDSGSESRIEIPVVEPSSNGEESRPSESFSNGEEYPFVEPSSDEEPSSLNSSNNGKESPKTPPNSEISSEEGLCEPSDERVNLLIDTNVRT